MVVATEQFVRGMRNARLGRLDEVTGGPWRGHFAPAPTERCLRTGYDGTNELNQLQEWKRRGAPKQQWAQQPTQQHVYRIEEHGATGRRLLFDVISRDAHGSSFLALQYGAALCLCGVRDLFNGNYAISCARPSPGRCTLITVALEFENYEAFHNPVGKGVKRPTLNRWTGGFRRGLNVSLYRHVHCEPRGTTPRATGLLNAPGSWVRKHDASVLALLRMAILTQNTARPWSAQDVLLLSLDVAHDAVRFANMDSVLEDLEELLEVLKEVRASPHHREAHVVLLNAIPWTRGTSTGWRNSWGAAAVNAHLTSWVRKSQLNVIVVDSGPIVGPRMDAHPDATHFLAPDCSGPAGYALMRHTMAAVCSAWSKRYPMRS